jgi:hypothetical protein
MYTSSEPHCQAKTREPDLSRGEEGPIFVVGVPRSGTTLMRLMLCAHSRICIAPETNYLNRWRRFYSHLDVTDPGQFDVFWSDFSKVEIFPSFDIDAKATLNRIRAARKHDHRTIFASLAQEYAARMGKARWGEKTPKHELYLDVLLKWYPAARVIFMIRDPRAVSASLLSKDWGGTYVNAHAERWRKSSIRAGLWDRDDRVHVVQYESLMLEPERVLKGICAFLGEEYEGAMIERPDAPEYVLYPRQEANRTDVHVVRPLDPGGIDKWRSRLSRRQVSVIEFIAGDEMARRGYDLDGEPLGLLGRLCLVFEKIQARIQSFRREPFRRVIAARARTNYRRFRG